jgi:phage-related protein
VLYLPNIRFGDIDFSGDGAYIWGAGEYSAPSRSVDFIEVPGRNGDLVIDNGNYNNIKARFSVVITRDVEKNTDRLKYLLYSQKGYQKLYDSDMKGFYRMACFSDGFDISSTDAGVVHIEFGCKPLKYDIMGEETVVLSGSLSYELHNPYFESARPLVTIYADTSSGTYDGADIWINDKKVHIKEVDDHITIDTELQDAYEDNKLGIINQNKNVSTADFCLKPEKNEITCSPNISKVEIKPRWVTI